MIRVGLVGEDPNDTSSVKNLLDRKYGQQATFIPLTKRIKGYHLDSPKIRKSLPIEFNDKSCQFVVYIRDLDDFPSAQHNIDARTKWFRELDATVNNQGILLLNIQELEALIFADMDTFNKMYDTEHSFNGNPMFQQNPKEQLKRITHKSKRRFEVAHCPDIFRELNLEKLEAKCQFFKDFIVEFEKKFFHL